MTKIRLKSKDQKRLKKLLRRTNYALIPSIIIVIVSIIWYLKTNPKIVEAVIVLVDNNFSEELNQKIDYKYSISDKKYESTFYGKKIKYGESVHYNQYDLKVGDTIKIKVEWFDHKNSSLVNSNYIEGRVSLLHLIFPVFFTIALIFTLYHYQNRKYRILTQGVVVKGNYISTKVTRSKGLGNAKKYLHKYEFRNPYSGMAQSYISETRIPDIYQTVNIFLLKNQKDKFIVFEYLDNSVQNLIIKDNHNLNQNIKYQL